MREIPSDVAFCFRPGNLNVCLNIQVQSIRSVREEVARRISAKEDLTSNVPIEVLEGNLLFNSQLRVGV
jgi:hypothetical protein